MELMELVENEPTARPFQCDWQQCNKVRRLSLLSSASSEAGLNLDGLPTPSPNHSCRCCSVDHQTNHNTFAEPRSLTGGSELQPQVRPAKTLPDTHQRETLCVQHTWMRQELHPKKRADRAYSHPYRREASPVPAHWMRKAVLRCKRRQRETARVFAATGYRDTDLSNSRPR